MMPTTTTQTTEKVEATVTAFGRIQPSRYGDEQVQSVLFERWDRYDESRKIWKTFSVAEARLFRKNQRVLLTPSWRNDRQSWNVERLGEPPAGSPPPYPTKSQYQEPEPEVAGTGHATGGAIAPRSTSEIAFGGSPGALYQHHPVSPTQAPPLSPNQKQEITTWLSHQADLYACCFSEAQRALSPQAPQEETVRACASSLFISATRKFRLEA